MKHLKLFTTLTSLIVLTLLTIPVYASDGIINDKDSGVCEKCEKFPGIEGLKSYTSDLNLKIANKIDALKKHLHRPSLISKDISYLPYLKKAKKGEVVFWYTILEF